jgi:hypothetical protein
MSQPPEFHGAGPVLAADLQRVKDRPDREPSRNWNSPAEPSLTARLTGPLVGRCAERSRGQRASGAGGLVRLGLDGELLGRARAQRRGGGCR